jgi:YHS domain-containing protein
MFKGSSFVSALAVCVSAGIFVIGAMPVEKGMPSNQGTETVAPVASEAQSGKKLKPQTTCPVMGVEIDKKVFVDYNGKRVYFCCPGCIETFKKDPAKYLKVLADRGESVEVLKKPKTSVKETDMRGMKMPGDAATKAAETDYWTCTMHPEIHQSQPGNCPICGMNLVFKKSGKDINKVKSMDSSKK